jgi:hypothetical protein
MVWWKILNEEVYTRSDRNYNGIIKQKEPATLAGAADPNVSDGYCAMVRVIF